MVAHPPKEIMKLIALKPSKKDTKSTVQSRQGKYKPFLNLMTHHETNLQVPSVFKVLSSTKTILQPLFTWSMPMSNTWYPLFCLLKKTCYSESKVEGGFSNYPRYFIFLIFLCRALRTQMYQIQTRNPLLKQPWNILYADLLQSSTDITETWFLGSNIN